MTSKAAAAHTVFVSHSRTDMWVAKQIARRIEECGANPFLDKAEIDVEDDFEEDIMSFLGKADELLVLLTPWASETLCVWAKLGAAWGKRIPMLGVLHGLSVGEIVSRPGIPILLKKRNFLPLNEIEKYFEQLRVRANRP